MFTAYNIVRNKTSSAIETYRFPRRNEDAREDQKGKEGALRPYYSVLIVSVVRKVSAGAKGAVNLTVRRAAAVEITVCHHSYFSRASHSHSDDRDFTFLSLRTSLRRR